MMATLCCLTSCEHVPHNFGLKGGPSRSRPSRTSLVRYRPESHVNADVFFGRGQAERAKEASRHHVACRLKLCSTSTDNPSTHCCTWLTRNPLTLKSGRAAIKDLRYDEATVYGITNCSRPYGRGHPHSLLSQTGLRITLPDYCCPLQSISMYYCSIHITR